MTISHLCTGNGGWNLTQQWCGEHLISISTWLACSLAFSNSHSVLKVISLDAWTGPQSFKSPVCVWRYERWFPSRHCPGTVSSVVLMPKPAGAFFWTAHFLSPGWCTESPHPTERPLHPCQSGCSGKKMILYRTHLQDLSRCVQHCIGNLLHLAYLVILAFSVACPPSMPYSVTVTRALNQVGIM